MNPAYNKYLKLETLMKCLHFKTGCMEKPSSLMQIPSKTTKERRGHIAKSFCFLSIIH